jgi:hypothetical protein
VDKETLRMPEKKVITARGGVTIPIDQLFGQTPAKPKEK